MFGVGLERWRARGGRFVRVLCGLLCFKDKVNLIPSAYGKKAAEGKKKETNVVSCFRVSTLRTFGFKP